MTARHHNDRPKLEDRLAAALRRLVSFWREKSDQDDKDKRRDHRWHKREVYGLWAAAVVGIAAIVASSIDSHHQKEVMQKQLEEMRVEQRPNLWVLSDLSAPEYVPIGGQIIWTVRLTNYGKSFVAKGTVDKYILIGHGAFIPTYREKSDPSMDQLTPIAPGQVVTETVVSPPGVTPEQFSSLLATTGGIQIKLVMEYQDLAGERYSSIVHLSRTNAGSIAFGHESSIR